MWWSQNNIRNLLLAVMGVCMYSLSAFGQFVNVKDPLLKDYLCTNFPLAMTGGCAQLDTLKAESQYKNLYKIQMSNKGVTSADEILFFKYVDTIYLNGNKLTSFPVDISRFRSLVRLNLANNQLTIAPSIHYTNQFTGDTAVKLVYLLNNKISQLPASWNSPNLITQVIDLENNELTGIAPFQTYPEIRRLNVSNNKLDFEDLIPVKSNPRWTTSQFDLFPQKPFFVMSNKELSPGDDVLIQVPGTVLPTNTYYLLKENVVVDVSTTGTFSIQSIQLDQAGSYTVKITNSNFPGALEFLESLPFYLDVRVVSKNQVVTFSPDGDGLADVIFIDGDGSAKIVTKNGSEIMKVALPYEWDGRDKSGKSLAPGLYYIQKSDGSHIKALLVN